MDNMPIAYAYAKLIMAGKKSTNDVPSKIRKEVEIILKESGFQFIEN